jgi:hypothetical protein
MAEETQGNQNIQANDDSIAVGSVSVGGSIDGSFIIGSHNVVGFTSDQVSTLLTQISTTFQVKPFDGRCPYKGLEVFGEEDAELFFGREKWVENLIGRVKESRTLFVTGQSGSGKSSLVRAGLIPTLKKTRYGEGWLYATLKPGRDPMESLATAFSRLKDPGLGKYLRENAGQASVLHECAESVLSERADQRLVLFLDQFEEIFTQLSKDKAQTFINLLAHAATVENGRVIILFSMRSDFVPNCATYPQLNELLNQQFVQIGAMQPEELVSAIAQPALRVGLKIDPDLIAQIINDMKGEPGALPLMQFALKDLFDAEQAKGGMIALTLSDYLEHGGINQALERHANASLAQLTAQEQELARNVFSGLIEIGRGTQDTRRTALSNELIPAGTQAEAVKTVVQKLANARLITTDATTVTISHEKLIDAWPWLKKLVNENRDVIALQNEIAADAKEWEEHKRDASYLYSGGRLVNANEQLKSNKLVLSGIALEYIRAGQARENRRRKTWSGSIIFIFVLLVTLVAIFANLRKEAQNTAIRSQAIQVGIQSRNLRSDAQTIQAFRVKHILTTTLHNIPNSQTSIDLINSEFDNAGSTRIEALAVSLNGQYLATGLENQIIVWNLRNLAADPIALKGHKDKITVMQFAPDGKILASADAAEIIFWDLESRSAVGQLPIEYRYSLTFHPDGKILVTGGIFEDIIVIDSSNPSSPFIISSAEISEATGIVRVSPDKKLIAASSIGAVYLLDATKELAELIKLPISENINDLAFSPDQKRLAVATSSEVLIFDSNDNYRGSPKRLKTTDFLVNPDIMFNPDGSLLAVGILHGPILVWDINKADEPPIIISTIEDFSKYIWLH